MTAPRLKDLMKHQTEAVLIHRTDINNLFKSRLMAGMDICAGVTGDEGEGKSMFTAKLCRKLWPDTFTFRKSIIYTKSPVEMDDRYNDMVNNGALQYDEAIHLLYKMDFMFEQQKEIVKKYAADVRKEKHGAHFLCIPNLQDLTSQFRNHRVKIWFELFPRADTEPGNLIVVVYSRVRNPFGEAAGDVWLLEKFSNEWRTLQSEHKLRRGEDRLTLMRTHPFYFGEMIVKKPSDKFEEKYLKCRLEAREKYGILDDAPKSRYEEKQNMRLHMLIYMLRFKERFSIERIAEYTGYSIKGVSDIFIKIRQNLKLYPWADIGLMIQPVEIRYHKTKDGATNDELHSDKNKINAGI